MQTNNQCGCGRCWPSRVMAGTALATLLAFAARARPHSHRLRRLAADLTHAEARERQRIADLLHDDFQQLLSAARLELAVVRPKADSEMADALDQVAGLLDRAIDASRTLAIELSPPALLQDGLSAALRWLSGHLQREHGLSVMLQLEEPCDPARDDPLGEIAFHGARELLFNVAKHAGVREARLHVCSDDQGALRLRVQDHGKGFAPEAADHPRAYGLASLRQRVEAFGGRLAIQSTPGEGTLVEITLPRGKTCG